MIRLLLVSALATVVGCGDRPVTRYIASNGLEVEATLLRAAHVSQPSRRRSRPDWGAPEAYSDKQQLLIPWFDDGDGAVATFDVTLNGARGTDMLGYPCRIQIGPNKVRRPVSVDFVFDLFEDKELSARVRAVVGAIPIRNIYQIDQQVEGFHIHFEQFEESLSWTKDNIFLELIIDGCNRVPTDRFPTRDDHGPAKWSD